MRTDPDTIEVELPYRYTPREYQLPAWRAMDDLKRVLMVWHRRAGKDKICFNKLICRAAETMANYAYYFPTAKLGRKALWKNVDMKHGMRVIDHIPKELLRKPPNETEMMIELINGSTIQVLGTDNLDVVGGNYFGVVFSEYQQQNPLAWDLTRPILAENGGFAWFNGTPRGENHLFDMLKTNSGNAAWFTQVLLVDDTHAITLEDIDEERRSGMSDALIRQEFYCDFSAPNERAVYGRFLAKAATENRIGPFPVDGRAPVHTSWDLGGPLNTVVWYWQCLPFGVIRLVDVDHGLKVTLTERVAHMNAKGYSLGKCYFPHDARQTARTGRTFEEDAREAGIKNIVVVPPISSVGQGVDYVAELFPTLEFREPACDIGIKGLKAYEWAPANINGLIRSEPLHNWASHIADALRTMAEANKLGLVDHSGTSRPHGVPVKVLTGYRGMEREEPLKNKVLR